MNLTAVLGIQWGDEGKGRIIDLLSEDVEAVVRYNGGNNAGHTLIVNNDKIVLHLIPSNILYPSQISIIGGGVVINPTDFSKEIAILKEKKLELKDKLKVSDRATAILPYHKALDIARENKLTANDKIGTTGKGIGPAYEDKVARRALRVFELKEKPEIAKLKIKDNLEYYNFLLEKRYNSSILNQNQVITEVFSNAEKWFPYVCDTDKILNDLVAKNKKVIFEGAQGTLLDLEYGTYPHVTSSNVSAGSIFSSTGLAPNNFLNIRGIFKAYTTRVGLGSFPTEISDENAKIIAQEGKEIGSTTGRKRRCGWLDLPALKYAIIKNGVKDLILTKIDVLDKLSKIKVAVNYWYNGVNIDFNPYLLSEIEVEYKEFPGWLTNTKEVNAYAELPKEAKNYLNFIQQQLQVKITLISNGPQRKNFFLNN